MLLAALFMVSAPVQGHPAPVPTAQTASATSAAAAPATDAPVADAVPPPAPAEPLIPITPSVADADVREFVAIVARKEAGRTASGGIGPADKLLVIGRGRGDFPEIVGSAGVSQRQQLMDPPADAVAMVRFRQHRDAVRPGPLKPDLDYAAQHKLPLFIIGEWTRDIPLWEVAWVGDHVLYRSIGDVGEIGPWHD